MVPLSRRRIPESYQVSRLMVTTEIWYDSVVLTKDPGIIRGLPRSGGGVVDNTLDYQSRGRKIDPPLLRSFG